MRPVRYLTVVPWASTRHEQLATSCSKGSERGLLPWSVTFGMEDIPVGSETQRRVSGVEGADDWGDDA